MLNNKTTQQPEQQHPCGLPCENCRYCTNNRLYHLTASTTTSQQPNTSMSCQAAVSHRTMHDPWVNCNSYRSCCTNHNAPNTPQLRPLQIVMQLAHKLQLGLLPASSTPQKLVWHNRPGRQNPQCWQLCLIRRWHRWSAAAWQAWLRPLRSFRRPCNQHNATRGHQP